MNPTATLFRFQIELSDVQRSVYKTLDFRLAQHPSETVPYLLTRVLAFALNCTDDLTVSAAGLSDPDVPALSEAESFGGFRLWIEVGSPSARKLHKATKAAKEVRVYTYKNPEPMLKEVRSENVHRAETIQFFSFPAEFLAELGEELARDNRWSLLFNDQLLTIQIGEKSFSGDLREHRLST